MKPLWSTFIKQQFHALNTSASSNPKVLLKIEPMKAQMQNEVIWSRSSESGGFFNSIYFFAQEESRVFSPRLEASKTFARARKSQSPDIHHVHGHFEGKNMRSKRIETNGLSEKTRTKLWQEQRQERSGSLCVAERGREIHRWVSPAPNSASAKNCESLQSGKFRVDKGIHFFKDFFSSLFSNRAPIFSLVSHAQWGFSTENFISIRESPIRFLGRASTRRSPAMAPSSVYMVRWFSQGWIFVEFSPEEKASGGKKMKTRAFSFVKLDSSFLHFSSILLSSGMKISLTFFTSRIIFLSFPRAINKAKGKKGRWKERCPWEVPLHS